MGKLLSPQGRDGTNMATKRKAVVQKYTAWGVETASEQAEFMCTCPSWRSNAVATKSPVSSTRTAAAALTKVAQLQSAHKLDVTIQRQNHLRS